MDAHCPPSFSLVKRTDVHGKSMYTDAQMETYLQRFEYFFLQDERRGLRTIDATEGGVRKAGTEIRTLSEALAEFAQDRVPELPLPTRTLMRIASLAAKELRKVAEDVRVIRAAAHRTGSALSQLTGESAMSDREDRLWKTVETERSKVGDRLATLRLLDEFSQLGVLKRAKPIVGSCNRVVSPKSNDSNCSSSATLRTSVGLKKRLRSMSAFLKRRSNDWK